LKPEQDLTLSGLIHDLNNVFQALADAADQLAEDPRWNSLSGTIFRSIDRGMRISRSLENSGPGAPLESIVDDAIAFVEDARLAAPGREIRFEKSIASDVVLRHNWAWERVLINLFLNAARAMPRGGTIHIDASRDARRICIAVRDTGSGISPEVLGNLFQPNVSTKPQGGLGLHVVEMIVQQDGGTVKAQNRADGPGAEFLIELPATAAAQPVA
jgi:two-component system, NtrC family, sensor histidine kinase HydH